MFNKIKKPIFKRWWFWLIIIVIVIAALANGGKEDDKNTTANATKKEDTKKAEKKEDTKINYENFLNIKMGMKYEDVIKVLGEGKQESSSEISGIKTAMYSWNGNGISNMNVTIQNNVVTGKAQLGLKEIDAKVTLDKFNQVKEGMTYDQAKGILGEGQIISQTKIMDMESIMYSWVNKDGSNMNCTFTGNKMDMKAQFNLK